LKQISKLKSWFNPDPSRCTEVQDSGRDLVVESADIALSTIDVVKEPKTFDEAYNHPNASHRHKWQEELSMEFDNMSAKEENSKVGIAQRSEFYYEHMGFKIKRTGVYRARLVACGYSQAPRVDFRRVLHH
jgi:phage terminase large subunit